MTDLHSAGLSLGKRFTPSPKKIIPPPGSCNVEVPCLSVISLACRRQLRHPSKVHLGLSIHVVQYPDVSRCLRKGQHKAVLSK